MHPSILLTRPTPPKQLALREAECAALTEQVETLTQELKRTQETLTAATAAAGGMEADDAGLRKKLSQVRTGVVVGVAGRVGSSLS